MGSSEGSAQGLTVVVDHGLCSGIGHCARRAPGVFRVRYGKSWVANAEDWPEDSEAAVRGAEQECPWFSITVSAGP